MLNGLQTLYVLRLQDAPAADSLPAAAEVWIIALWRNRAWEEGRDVPRLRGGFLNLAATAHGWPAPAALIAALPPAPGLQRLPAPKHVTDRSADIAMLLRALGGANQNRPSGLDCEGARRAPDRN